MDTLVNAGAVVYGLLLVAALFVRAPLTEALRIDALFLPHADDRTRVLNGLVGVAVAAYGAWSLWLR